jgi:hypothetical protein
VPANVVRATAKVGKNPESIVLGDWFLVGLIRFDGQVACVDHAA